MFAHARRNDIGVTHQCRAAVMIDNALRIARRAGRVIQRYGIPFVSRQGPVELRIAGSQEFLVIFGADARTLWKWRVRSKIRIVIVNDQWRDVGFFKRLCNDTGELPVHDQDFCAGMVELEGDDRRIETGIERMQHGTGHRHAVMGFQHGRCI